MRPMAGAVVTALELVRRDFEVKRGWSLANTHGRVVMRPMAGAVVTAEVTSISDGDATQMRANSENNEPLGFDGTLVVSLTIAKKIKIDCLL